MTPKIPRCYTCRAFLALACVILPLFVLLLALRPSFTGVIIAVVDALLILVILCLHHE